MRKAWRDGYLTTPVQILEREFPDDKEKLGAGHSHLAMAHIVQNEFEEAKKELRLGETVTGTHFFYSVQELEKIYYAVCLRQKYQGYLMAHGSTTNPPSILLAASEDLQVPLALLPAEMHAPGVGQTLGGSFPIHHAYRTPTVGQVPPPAGASKSVPLVQCRNHAMTLFSDGSIQMSPE